MDSFEGRTAAITGGGTGMGRELAIQLAADGCHVAMCDVSADNMADTAAQAAEGAPTGTRITTFVADVADEAQVLAFRDHVAAEHGDVVHLLFNNAGIGGGGSIVTSSRHEWEHTFNVDFYGVYYGTRAFLPLLLAADEGHVVNTSSVNGFYAALGPTGAHTAYSAAKFAVKGFTEALVTDFRMNAPHLHAHVVMPGHIGTSIVANSVKILGDRTTAEGADGPDVLGNIGVTPADGDEAATTILDAVRADRWRVLVGEDAIALDAAVRADPEGAYEPELWGKLQAEGHFGAGR